MTSIDYISIDKIIRLGFKPTRQTWRFHWKDATPEKKFFGWVRKKSKPEGWYYNDTHYTEEYILMCHDNIFKNSDALPSKSLWEKAIVEIIYIGGKYTSSTNVYFEKNEDALSFIESIVSKFPHLKIE